MIVVAVDFDATCVDHRYPDRGRSVPGAARVLRRLTGAGHRLILLTMRSGPTLDAAVEWFHGLDIPLWAVNENPEQKTWTESPKVYANLYIDDAALGCPLVELGGFKRPCVDWEEVERILEARGLIPVEV